MVPEAIRFSVKQDAGGRTGRVLAIRRQEPGSAVAAGSERGTGGAAVGAGAVLEVALPIGDLRRGAEAALAFFVAVYDPQSDRARAASGAPADRVDGCRTSPSRRANGARR